MAVPWPPHSPNMETSLISTKSIDPFEIPSEYRACAKIDWGALAQFDVFTPHGEIFKFRSLYTLLPHEPAGPVIIHFLSSLSGAMQLAQWSRALDHLTNRSARLVFLSSRTPAQCARFLGRYEEVEAFPGELFCDPTLQIYKAFNLKRGVLRTVVPSRAGAGSVPRSDTVYRALRKRVFDRRALGDPWQMGGIFVVEGKRDSTHFRPNLMFARADRSSVETGAVDEVLEALGCYEDAVQVEATQALSDYYKRESSPRVDHLAKKDPPVRQNRVSLSPRRSVSSPRKSLSFVHFRADRAVPAT